jgi:hypothetical protein
MATLLCSVMLSEPIVSGIVMLLVGLLASKSNSDDSKQLDPLSLLAVD